MHARIVRRQTLGIVTVCCVLGVALTAGCQREELDRMKSEAGVSGAQKEINEALAMLSPEDRKLAIAQGVCPVGGGKLGSMGAPPKVVVEGRTVFLCCEGCESMLREKPEEYLAKLDGKPPVHTTTTSESIEDEPMTNHGAGK